MIDQSAQLAEFFVGEGRGKPKEELAVVVRDRWPDITQEQIRRAVDIAQELLHAEAAEHFAEAEELRRIAAAQRTARGA